MVTHVPGFRIDMEGRKRLDFGVKFARKRSKGWRIFDFICKVLGVFGKLDDT
jgi:hypothetical protein